VKRCTYSVWLRRTSNQPAVTSTNPSSTSPALNLRGRRALRSAFARTWGISFPAAYERSSARPQVSVVRPRPSEDSRSIPRFVRPKDSQFDPKGAALRQTSTTARGPGNLANAAGKQEALFGRLAVVLLLLKTSAESEISVAHPWHSANKPTMATATYIVSKGELTVT
jgi:hypothetical protein